MNTTSIINSFKRVFTPHVKTRLGRWNIHNYSETTLKIKYATEDNCGVYSRNYQENDISAGQVELYDDKKYIYMMGYESVHLKH
jgi:hypothetical protein